MGTQCLTVMVAATIWALTALSTEAQEPPQPAPINHQAKDLIDAQPHHAKIIAGPLSHESRLCPPYIGCIVIDEYQTLREAMWKRQAEMALTTRTYGIIKPLMIEAMSYDHLMAGGNLRHGDLDVLHGMLLSARQPNTFALAKKWQQLCLEVSCLAGY